MLQAVIAFAGILGGTFTDVHHREVPDWLNYGMIGVGVSLAAMESLAVQGVVPLLGSLAGLLLGTLAGAAMFYSGQWGGGDWKMVAGIGALLGLPFSSWIANPPLLVLFLILTLFAGAAYGLAWMIFLLIRNRSRVRSHLATAAAMPAMQMMRYASIGVALVIALLAFLLPMPQRLLMLLVAGLAYFAYHLGLIVKSVEAVSFMVDKPVNELVVGDWLAEDVTKGKRVIVERTRTGLTEGDLALLQDSKVKTVRVKEAIPFVPSFLIAYTAALIAHSVSWMLW